ncbi:MAG: Flp pilus assembly complex ATPase component [Alphaproteobacteria bacterium]|nr:Flp pilus assembly complex ATPase component [Alphaproteobacteria bacterium]NCQ87760.1 Flp pilus assembly complex ATPase component [Alphaproteobacteria bacterium]NCT05732.1 Flp pilus assembly complex ATPase component [Alphaproteobacteria bacterium]
MAGNSDDNNTTLVLEDDEMKDIEHTSIDDVVVEVLSMEEMDMNPDISMNPDAMKNKSTGRAVEAVGGRGLDLADGKNKEGKLPLGEQMVQMGLIDADQLNVALQEKKLSNKMVGEILVDLGFIDSETLASFLAKAAGFEVFDPKAAIIDGEALAVLQKKLSLKHLVLPYMMDKENIYVAMADPYDVVALDMLKRFIPKGLKIKQTVTTASILEDAIDAAYGYASSIKVILKELEESGVKDVDVADLDESDAYSHPIVRLVNALIYDAVKLGASDLHFEPEENFVRLRYRVDGSLYTAQILHKQHWDGIGQRLKIMASLNIADKLAPQDGRIEMDMGGRRVDFRVSSLPTVFGENIVLRVLDKQSSIMPLKVLGFSEVNKERIIMAQKRPEGIIIVTGPTGSGKTTTLYSMLNEINDVQVNIQTLEDPVEYSLPMIRQTAVREGVLSFADGIRALLRQDPDIIFIGEVRDPTTAEMALQAAMTGHQVYTSLHTNDSFGAIPRLFDLGMKPGMIAGNIVSIFAQRLARTLCKTCKEEYRPTDEECKILGVTDIPDLFKAKQGGCDQCGGVGYKGRVAVAEVLLFNEAMDEVLAKGGMKAELKDLAIENGFKSMKDDGILKILEGKTDFAGLAKVVDVTKD